VVHEASTRANPVLLPAPLGRFRALLRRLLTRPLRPLKRMPSTRPLPLIAPLVLSRDRAGDCGDANLRRDLHAERKE